MKKMKRWLSMVLIISIIGGIGLLGSNGVPEDDPDDWIQYVKVLEEDMVHNS